jgi:hypothetical protein
MTWLPLWFLLALGQSQPTVSSPPPPPNLEAGTFADGVYRNASLGLVYQFPIISKDMKKIYESSTQEPRHEKKQSPPRTGITIWLIDYRNVSSGSESPFTARYRTKAEAEIMVFNDQYYSDLGDALSYLQDWRYSAKRRGYQIPGDVAERRFSAQRFYQFEYVDIFGSHTRVVMFATVWRGYLVAFGFTTDDVKGFYKEQMECIVSSMNSIQLTDPGSPEAKSSPHPTDGSSDPPK